MNKPSITEWSTSELGPQQRYDAWVDVLNANYGSWQVDKPKGSIFNADVQRVHNGSLTLIKCVCDPCAATRPPRLARMSEHNFAALQLVVAGREHIDLDGERTELGKGDLFLWDSTRAMRFEVTERLKKVSVFIPLEQLRRWLPQDWRSSTGKLPRDSASYILLRSHIAAMARPGFADTEFSGSAMLDASLAMLAGGGQASSDKTSSVAAGQLRTIKAYIKERLNEPELTLTSIATDHGISLRYLHWLFGRTHQTAAAYILDARLSACRNDLLNPAMASKAICDIAYQWGFTTAAHFSRTYRGRFGESASDTRKRVCD